MRRFPCLLILLTCASTAWAQQSGNPPYPKYEVFAGYSVLGDLNSQDGRTLTFFGSNAGLEASVTRNLSKHWGIKGDFSAHFGTERGSGSFGQPFAPPDAPIPVTIEFEHRLFNFLIGPEFKARNSSRFTPFAHALAGVGHARGEVRIKFTSGSGLIKVSDTGFALALGGGVDFRVSKRVSLRLSTDYNPEYAGGSAIDRRSWRDHLRISIGIVIH